MRKKPHWSWWTKIRREYLLQNYNLMSLDDMADFYNWREDKEILGFTNSKTIAEKSNALLVWDIIEV